MFLQFLFSGLTSGSIYGLVALGFTAIYNATGVVNVAQGEFVMLGGLFTFTLYRSFGLPLMMAMLLAIALVTLVGILFQMSLFRPSRKTPGLNLVMITIGASIVFSNGALILWGKDALSYPSPVGETPIWIAGAVVQPQSILVVVVTLAVMVGLHVFYKYTKMGLGMLAAAINKDAASAIGINVGQAAMLSFALAALLGGLGGVLITPLTTAHYEMGLSMTLKGFAGAMLGGLGNTNGALLGGLLLGVLEAMGTGFVSSSYKDMFAMVILILVLMLRPGGLLGSRAVSEEV
jgi:branched-chain amino acid transport system permease protein